MPGRPHCRPQMVEHCSHQGFGKSSIAAIRSCPEHDQGRPCNSPSCCARLDDHALKSKKTISKRRSGQKIATRSDWLPPVPVGTSIISERRRRSRTLATRNQNRDRQKQGRHGFFLCGDQAIAFKSFGKAAAKRSSLSSGPALTRMQRFSGSTPGMRMKTPCSISPSTIDLA